MPDSYTPSPEVVADVESRFTYHPPKPDQPARFVVIRDAAKSLAVAMTGLCPPSRDLSTALTLLDEVVMHANAAIVRNES